MQFKLYCNLQASFTSQLGWVRESKGWVATAQLPGNNNLQQSVHPPRPNPPHFLSSPRLWNHAHEHLRKAHLGVYSLYFYMKTIKKLAGFGVGGKATLRRLKLWSKNGITETPGKMQFWLRLYTEGLGKSTLLYLRSRKYKIPNINGKLKIFYLVIHSCCINFFPSVLWTLS